ncbi:MAG: hypothetical protein PHY92_01555 [Alphaproteobacteria bacterium]|nr:hypothetical protein [Alphaproteobacteria bacterium]
MVDTYLTAANEAAFRAFLSFFSQVIGLQKGRAAVEADPDNGIEAQPAAGDPLMFYACVRAPFAVPAMEGTAVIAAEEGEAILGKWA